jgi:hypothetical protein
MSDALAAAQGEVVVCVGRNEKINKSGCSLQLMAGFNDGGYPE